jgi:hypothetical protein
LLGIVLLETSKGYQILEFVFLRWSFGLVPLILYILINKIHFCFFKKKKYLYQVYAHFCPNSELTMWLFFQYLSFVSKMHEI